VWRRVGGGILAVVLGLLAWAFVAGAFGLADTEVCGKRVVSVESLFRGEELQCFDGSELQRKAGVALGLIAAVVLAAAALTALTFTIGRRRGPLLARLIAVAALLVAITALVVLV
jgi:hypothetical protein